MLLDRLHRPVRGVRIVRREHNDPDPSFRVQIVPLRMLGRSDVERLKTQFQDAPGPIVTSALGHREQAAFLEAGFSRRESLYLLRHDLTGVPPENGPAKIRNARRADLDTVLQIDREGFDNFWVFDREAIAHARKATPNHRYVVATIDRTIVGYAITGHANKAGYLQRLGVAAQSRRQGIGGQLITDSLHWAARAGAREVLVNTQEINETARNVYERHGFVLDDERLTVLEWER